MTYTANLPMSSRDVRKYCPLDVVLEHPRIRILRLLSRFDWLSAHEIAEHLGVLWSPQIRNAYASHLCRMRKSGMLIAREPGVGKRGDYSDTFGSFGGPDYRISPAARADLPRIIERASRARR